LSSPFRIRKKIAEKNFMYLNDEFVVGLDGLVSVNLPLQHFLVHARLVFYCCASIDWSVKFLKMIS